MQEALPFVARLRRTMDGWHHWLIMSMLAVGAALHYSAQIRSVPETPFALTRHAMVRVLFMLPVAHAAFALGMTGGIATAIAAFLIMLPRVLYLSLSPVDAMVETIAVTLVGVLISWMVETQQREKRLRQEALTELHRSRAMLRHYLREIIKAQEDERRRLARELHDDTAQAMVILSHQLDALCTYPEKLPEPVVQRLEELLELSDDTLRGVRCFSHDLRPPVLDDLGLVPALESLTADLPREGTRTELDVLGHRRSLSPEVELALFRITQEALRNVQNHAEASEVRVRVDFEDARVRIEVRDNGKGFRMPPEIGNLAEVGKLGLLGMQERVQLIGGSLKIQSELGEGTTIVVDVPA